MRLVMKYSVSDGCTFNCDVVLPVEYESAEAALLDFETLVKKDRKFTLFGEEFYSSDFEEHASTDRGLTLVLPEFLTVD